MTLENLDYLLDKLPNSPLRFIPSSDQLFLYQLCLLVIGHRRSAEELAKSMQILWDNGRFLAATLCIRHLIEIWGALCYANRKVLDKWKKDGDLSVAGLRIQKLLAGSKSHVPMPSGERLTINPINVMEFIRQIEPIRPDIENTYSFLCDGCHPSYLQHSYLLAAGLDHDNWSNQVFASVAHGILERSLSAGEAAVQGFVTEGTSILKSALPIIVANET